MNPKAIVLATLTSLCAVDGHKQSRSMFGTTLLSRLMPSWSLRRHTNLALNVPTCSVAKSYPYTTSVNVRVYGILKNYSAILTGYPANTTMDPGKQANCGKDKCMGLQNRGVLYGWVDKVRPALTSKSSFVFHTDYALQRPRQGSSAEYCVHIYSPPIGQISEIKRATGTKPRDPSRNFGSDERLERIIRTRTHGNSKKLTTCCFLLHG